MNVVFLHAFPLDGRMWDRQVARFGGSAPDLYGLGATIDSWAEAVLESVVGDVALVGSSMGGYTALVAAELAPTRVKALVLVGSRADADSPERRVGREATIRTIREEGLAALWEQMRERAFAPDAPADTVARAREITLSQDADLLVRGVEAMRDRADTTETLRRFGGRLLVIVGELDPFVSPAELEGFVAPASLRVVEGAGHLLTLERPEWFEAQLAQVLE